MFLIFQVFLFTYTIGQERTEFFYNSREVFENLFFKDFKGNPRGIYTAFSIQELFQRFDHICQNVRASVDCSNIITSVTCYEKINLIEFITREKHGKSTYYIVKCWHVCRIRTSISLSTF